MSTGSLGCLDVDCPLRRYVQYVGERPLESLAQDLKYSGKGKCLSVSALVRNACGREVNVSIGAGFYRNGEDVPASSLFTPQNAFKELLTAPGGVMVERPVVTADGIAQAWI